MDPRSIEAANTRAVMLKDEGKHDEARDYLHGGLRAAKLHLGGDHPTTLSIMTNLSALLDLYKLLGGEQWAERSNWDPMGATDPCKNLSRWSRSSDARTTAAPPLPPSRCR